jgi:hypothetical protein
MIKILTVIFFSLLFVTGAYGEDLYTECSYCDSSDRVSLAKSTAVNEGSYSPTTGGIVIVFIYDDTLSQLFKYSVNISIEKEIGLENIVNATEISLSNSEVSAETQLSNSKYYALSVVFDIEDDVADSVYDIIGLSSVQAEVIDDFTGQFGLEEKLETYIGTVLSIAGKVVNVNFVIQVEFSDGSSALFKITGIDGYGNVTYKLSQDSFSVPSESIEDFVGAMNNIGIPVSYTFSSSETSYRCSSTVDNGVITLTCTRT